MSEVTPQVAASFHAEASRCASIADFQRLAQRYGTVNHPYIPYYTASLCLYRGYKDQALDNYIRACSFGLQFPNPYWKSEHSDTIGSAIANMLASFTPGKNDEELVRKLYALAYAYLSQCISMLGLNAMDSYFNRAKLMSKNSRYVTELTQKYLGLGVLPQLMALSDFYYSAVASSRKGFRDDAQKSIQNARQLHQWLEDISVSGRDADTMSLEELASIGKERNELLFRNMTKDVLDNKFSLPLNTFADQVRAAVGRTVA